VDLPLIAEAISEFRPDNNRSQVIQSGTNLIWLDAYNANPSSMEKAIENFAKLDFDQKVLILGDMFEMGEQAAKEHDLLLQKIAVNQFSDVLLLGSNFEQVAANVGLKAYKSMGELREFIKSVGYTDTAFLIKGSRGMKMEDVVEALVK
jgi:UDP-N-acetylmuramoyl-tripeptide--D-alanyl-D-alanine ligase